MPPQSLQPGKGVTMCVYGLPGAGKTRLLGSANSALIIRPPTEHTDSVVPHAGVEEWIADDWATMLEIEQWGQQGGFKEYDWVGLDSISSMQDFLLDDVLEDAIIRKPTRAVSKGGVQVPEYGPDQGEYRVNMDRIRKWVADMVGFAKSGMFNLMITAHPFEWYDPVKEQDLWAPWVQGKNMSPKICGYMNIVAYMQAEEKEDDTRKELLFVDAEGFVGKDQFKVFPKLKSGRHGFLNPTMADIEAAINKRRKPTSTGGRRKKATKAKPTRRRK